MNKSLRLILGILFIFIILFNKKLFCGNASTVVVHFFIDTSFRRDPVLYELQILFVLHMYEHHTCYDYFQSLIFFTSVVSKSLMLCYLYVDKPYDVL